MEIIGRRLERQCVHRTNTGEDIICCQIREPERAEKIGDSQRPNLQLGSFRF